MTPLDIKIELMRNGKTARSICRDLGVSHSAVWQVINRGMVSTRIMEAVAAAIGKDKSEVFPAHFGPENESDNESQTIAN